MRFGIDACCWSNRRGFGRFTRELVTHMLAEAPQHEFTLVVDRWTAASWTLPAAAQLELVATREQPTRAASATGARSLADIWRLSRAASRQRFDAFLFPAVYSYFPLLRRTPLLVGFHDATAERHPQLVFPGRRARLLWALKTWLARRQATRILTVSESAKREIQTIFRVPGCAIHVVGEGADPRFESRPDPRGFRELRRRYGLPAESSLLLHVGGFSPHKNLERLLTALARLTERPDWHLVLAGELASDAFHSSAPRLRDEVRRRGLQSRVSFTGHVPDDDLILLYNAATMLVLPSLAEGFGLPALEAMACGLPVAASRAGSLPELLNDAGLLFDPLEPDEMAATLEQALADQGLRQRLRTAGLERARAFSWTVAARRTVRLLEELCGA